MPYDLSQSQLRDHLSGQIPHNVVGAVLSSLSKDHAFSHFSPGGSKVTVDTVAPGGHPHSGDEVVVFGPDTSGKVGPLPAHASALLFESDHDLNVTVRSDLGLHSKTLMTGGGDDTIAMTGRADHYISSGGGDDSVLGGGGKDTILGGLGDDTLKGGAGNDTIEGDAGNDKMSGGAGRDKFIIHALDGDDTVDGGKGVDTVSFTDYDKHDASISHDGAHSLTISFADGTVVHVHDVEFLHFHDGNEHI